MKISVVRYLGSAIMAAIGIGFIGVWVITNYIKGTSSAIPFLEEPVSLIPSSILVISGVLWKFWPFKKKKQNEEIK